MKADDIDAMNLGNPTNKTDMKEDRAPRSYFGSLLPCVILICGLQAATTLAEYNPPSFDGSRSYPALGDTLSAAAAVATGDFNGDGGPDMVAATPETDGVSVFLNNGDGTFAKAVHYPTGGFPSYVAVGDFNGDGKLDLVTANGSGSVSILLGNGDGTFQPPRTFSTGPIATTLAIADLNHDGKLDVVVNTGATGNPSQLFVLLGNGDGTLQTAMRVTTPDSQSYVVIGDFNGDGNADIVTGNSDGAWILFGNGDGTFQTALPVPAANVGPYGNSVAVGDFNGDGNLDLAIGNSAHQVSNSIPGTVSILLGNGDGTFRAAEPVLVGTYPYSVRTADLNGDGRLDLVVGNAGDADVSILFGNGDGTFQSAVNYPIGADFLTTAAVADFDGDGKPDVAISSALTDDVSVLLNKGDGTFHDVKSYQAGTQPYAIAMGDFNHDGIQDIALADSGTSITDTGSNKVSVLLGNGDGTFRPAANYAVGKLPSSIAAYDFNGDGNLDLAVVNHQDGTISILFGNGDGTFQSAVTYTAGTNAIGLVVADLNADGKVDLATGSLGSSNTDQVTVLLGNGDGTFQAPLNSAIPGNGIEAVAEEDFNGDGKPDLAVASYYSNNVVIVLGNGDGTFQPAGNTLSALGPVSVAAADLNGDGKVDLVVGNYTTSNLAIFLGSGDGTFQASPSYYQVGNDPLSIVVADLNGDGKPDLAVANVNDNFVSILQGKGDGTFSEAINYAGPKGSSAIAVGDVNGDGKPDIAIAGYWFNQVSILLNDTATPVQLISAASRKVHGSAGPFDIDLPLIGNHGIECRSGGVNGDYSLVFRFVNTLSSVGSASVSGGSGSISSGYIDSNDAHNYIANLTGVTNAQVITVSLNDVSDSVGDSSAAVSVAMGVLIGDTNADGFVNSADISQAKSQSGQAVTGSNFREDLNGDGFINSADISLVKSKSGTAFP